MQFETVSKCLLISKTWLTLPLVENLLKRAKTNKDRRMFNKKSLIIVGAGASTEVSMPAGGQLKRDIARLLNIEFEHGTRQKSGDFTICNALRIHVRQPDGNRGDINPHLYSAWHIRDAMPQAPSIDNFIDTHSADEKIELCEKLGIVQSILQAEKNSLLYLNPREQQTFPDFSILESTWYHHFFQLLTENCQVDDIQQRFESIAFIVFNYDRCIEHYLCLALRNYYKISEEHAAKLVQSIEIHHPYGIVGLLPWQKGAQSVPYGGDPNPQELLALAKQIKTFNEGTDPESGEIIAIRRNVQESEIIVFLGFAFHKQNMELIKPDGTEDATPSNATDYYATAIDISNSDCLLLGDELNKLCKSDALVREIRNDLKCADIFNEYRRALSLA